MESGEQVVRDVKRCVQIQEDLRTEVLSLNGQIALETQNLSLLKKDETNLNLELSKMNEAIKSLREQEQFLNCARDGFNKALQWRLNFKKLVADMDPNNEQIDAMYHNMQNRYSTLVECYEQKPEYRQIVEAETIARQLTEVVGEKRNELMKLDTEREYN